MNNKIILAYYINVGNASINDVKKILEDFKPLVKDEDMIQYFIPIKEGETKIECIYPKYVLGEKVDEDFKSVIKKLENHVKKIIDE